MRSSYAFVCGVFLIVAIVLPDAAFGQARAGKAPAKFMKGDFTEVLFAPNYRPEDKLIVEPKGEFAKIDVARSNDAMRGLRAAQGERKKRELIKKIIDDADAHTPPALYVVALELFKLGDHDDAGFWYLLAYLRTASDIAKSGDPSTQAAWNALSEIGGKEVIAQIDRDWNKADEIYDKVIDWDRTHARRYDRRWVALHGMAAFSELKVDFAPAKDWVAIEDSYRESDDQGFHKTLKQIRRFDRNSDGRLDDAEALEMRQTMEREATDGALETMAPKSGVFVRGDFFQPILEARGLGKNVKIVEPKGDFAQIDVARSNDAMRRLLAASANEKPEQIKKILDEAETYTPPVLHAVAAELFRLGDREEAMFWFSVAQMRAASDIRKSLDPTAAHAMAILVAWCQRDVDRYTLQNLSKLDVVFQRSMKWERAHPRRYDRRWVALHGDAATAGGEIAFMPKDGWKANDDAYYQELEKGNREYVAQLRSFDKDGNGALDEREAGEFAQATRRQPATETSRPKSQITAQFVKGDFTEVIFARQYAPADVELVEPKGDFAKIDVKKSNDAMRRLLSAKKTREEQGELIKQIVADADSHTPPVLYVLAAQFSERGEHDEAMFWFLLGQLRAQSDALKSRDASTQAAPGALAEVCGEEFRERLFQDWRKFDEVFDKVVDWDRKHPRRYDPRWVALHGLGAMMGERVEFASEKEWIAIDEKHRAQEAHEWHELLTLMKKCDRDNDGKLDEKESAEFGRELELAREEAARRRKPPAKVSLVQGDFAEVFHSSQYTPLELEVRKALGDSSDDVEIIEPKGEFAKIEVAKSNDAIRQLRSAVKKDEKRDRIKQILADADAHTPPVLHVVAAELFALGERDEAAFWFYLAQLRVASDILKSRDPTTEVALAELEGLGGAKVKAHAMKDWKKLDETYDRVLDWDRDHPRRYDARWIALHGRAARNGELVAFEPAQEWKTIDERQRTAESQEFHRLLKLLKKCDRDGDGQLNATETAAFQREAIRLLQESERK